MQYRLPNFLKPENPLEGSPFNERISSLFARTNSLWIAAREGGANGALYCGIDLHSNNCWITIIDEDQKVVRDSKFGNDLAAILGFFEPYRAELEGIAVESTFNWYWLVDGLMDAGYRLHLTNTWNGARFAYSDIPETGQPRICKCMNLAPLFHYSVEMAAKRLRDRIASSRR